METSPSIKEISAALRQFRSNPTALKRDGTNPHFKSKFATLNNTIESIEEYLDVCKLSFAQFPDGDGLTTIIMHDSGEWIKATANLHLAKNDPQGQGSAITYMRRYALSAALGLVTEEDDDGNEASAPRQTAQKPATATKPAPPSNPDIARIKELCGLSNVEYTRSAILAVTKLEFKPENYAAIIDRLSALADELKTAYAGLN